MPRGRSLWIVTMKFRPVKIELNPSRKTPEDDADDGRRRLHAVRRIERPAGVHGAEHERGQGEDHAEDVEVIAGKVQPREGDVLGPQHQRQDEVPKAPGMPGISTRKIMTAP